MLSVLATTSCTSFATADLCANKLSWQVSNRFYNIVKTRMREAIWKILLFNRQNTPNPLPLVSGLYPLLLPSAPLCTLSGGGHISTDK